MVTEWGGEMGAWMADLPCRRADNGEPMQILRYEHGQKYEPHQVRHAMGARAPALGSPRHGHGQCRKGMWDLQKMLHRTGPTWSHRSRTTDLTEPLNPPSTPGPLFMPSLAPRNWAGLLPR